MPHLEPTVLLGIFPAAVVHIRTDDDGAGADAQLAEAYMRALHLAEEKAREVTRPVDTEELGPVTVDPETWQSPAGPGGVGLGLRGAEVSAARKAENRKSLRVPELLSRSDRALSQDMRRRGSALEGDKEQPPIPTLTAGDSTLAGARYPLVDEIACAVRDWYAVSLYPLTRHERVADSREEAAYLPCQPGVPLIRHNHAAYRRFAARQTATARPGPLGRRDEASHAGMRLKTGQVQRRARPRSRRAELGRW